MRDRFALVSMGPPVFSTVAGRYRAQNQHVYFCSTFSARWLPANKNVAAEWDVVELSED
jgi:hypothetical protein